jgi:hypothetical protein
MSQWLGFFVDRQAAEKLFFGRKNVPQRLKAALILRHLRRG